MTTTDERSRDTPAHTSGPGSQHPVVLALLGRLAAGLGVQALWSPLTGDTFITVSLDGATQTFPVPSDSLLDAFVHPYAYGATLSL